MLEIVGFDVADENGDEINEPGEHLLVSQLQVRNAGVMPTPGNRAIRVLMEATKWLEPVTSEPVHLPLSIEPGQTVSVLGVLRARIRTHMTDHAGPRLHLDDKDTVSLIATFYERLNRPLLAFGDTLSKEIQIRYPLRLGTPRYLSCVAKGAQYRVAYKASSNPTISPCRNPAFSLTKLTCS